MSHGAKLDIDLDAALEADPMRPRKPLSLLLWGLVTAGVIVFLWALAVAEETDKGVVWAAFFINLIFWMGLAAGGVVISLILQIVRAQWSPPIRRIAEANVAFLPYAYFLVLFTYFGKEYLFPWARGPMPGREWWMQPDFVYLRFAILLALLFILFYRFVRTSVRGDVGMLRELGKNKSAWGGMGNERLTEGWKGADVEVPELQRKMSCSAPVLIFLYATIYSLFAFEMVMGMDTIWYSNMYGGFTFIGNIYIGWASLALLVIAYDHYNRDYAKVISTNQLWDMGKLTFGFCMLWGYMFFSQFLPQWYGNLPEETQWLILRTRELPWKTIAYIVFSMCFVVPFVSLISRDLKKTPWAYASVCLIILLGVWGEKYVTIMPAFSPNSVPLIHSDGPGVGVGIVEVAVFLGFLGAYLLSIRSFLAKVPFLPVSHPMTRGSIDW